MSRHSTWKRVDMHIHSKKSNEVKDNDYKGKEYSAKELLDKLLEDNVKVDIFSITDHNCINVELYKDLETLIVTDEYKDRINYIVGVELDVYDSSIYTDVFHCLCFFGNNDIDNIKSAIDLMFDNKELKERNIQENYPNITTIFKALSDKNIQDIVLIPHYNNKTKGLPSKIAIENLNYLCFNAYEDSNNIANINKSLNIYLKAGYDNFPFAVFSDCHNIENYPNEDNQDFIPCYILGNLDYPFNSVKTAFQEPRLRISLDNINNIRSKLLPEKYIEKVLLNGKYYALSPYQNTIIGKFGSGKSLLLQKLKEGSSSLKNHEKYDSFYSPEENFKLYVSNNPVDSIDEILAINSDIKKYEFLQQEDYSFKSYLTLTEAKSLFGRINIKYEFIKNKTFDFNIDEIVESFKDTYDNINSNGDINNLNYEKAFSEEEYYSINFNEYKTNYNLIFADLNQNSQNLEDLKSKKVSQTSIFDSSELTSINNVKNIIDYKLNSINYLNNSSFEEDIKQIISNYNNEYINNNAKQSKNKFVNDLDELLKSIKKLNDSCNTFELKYNSNIHEKFKEPIISDLYENYKISASYMNLDEFKSPIKHIIKDSDRKDNLFNSLISVIFNKSLLAQNKKISEFKSVIKKYCESIENIFGESNVIYDILYKKESMLKKSAGEKSSLFIKLIFDLIENDLKNNKNIILILDQPESNIDNDNIYKEISSKLRALKIQYNNFQSIIITHNANVGITADSENIIIAKEEVDKDYKKHFSYSNGCIENTEFIFEVCNILEGGKKAMEQRTIKYGINIIKKVDKNEL